MADQSAWLPGSAVHGAAQGQALAIRVPLDSRPTRGQRPGQPLGPPARVSGPRTSIHAAAREAAGVGAVGAAVAGDWKPGAAPLRAWSAQVLPRSRAGDFEDQGPQTATSPPIPGRGILLPASGSSALQSASWWLQTNGVSASCSPWTLPDSRPARTPRASDQPQVSGRPKSPREASM